MTFRFLLILLLCLPLAAWSQTVTVRSGEHEGFTRLTLSMPYRVEWRATRTGAGVTLSFDGFRPVFDLDAALERIPRTRVTGIRRGVEAGTLEIMLGCDCRISEFWHGDALLVLDFLDVATDSRPPASVEKQRAIPQRTLTPDSMPRIGASKATELMLRGLEMPDEIPATRAAAPDTVAPAPDLPKMRDELARKIGRAATQGLLEPSTLRADEEPSDPPPAPEGNQASFSQSDDKPDQPVVTEPTANMNIKAETGTDLELLRNMGARLPTTNARSCLPDDRLNIGTWAEEGTFWSRIGAGRAHLTNEIDRVDPDAARDLARAYIYFGFGAEASQVLAMVAQPTSDHLLLDELATILEAGSIPDGATGILSGQTGCPSTVAMWSVLAQETLTDPGATDRHAILRSFNALPLHLRAHLGPILARRFVDAGDQGMVGDILNILDRGVQPPDSEANLVMAEAALAKGDEDGAAQGLMDVVQSNTRPSAEALIRLVETRSQSADGLSFELAQLAGAYATENRGTALQRDLEWAHVMALAASGAFAAAFEVLDRVEDDLPSERSDTRSAVAGLLADRADDITFLRRVIGGDAGQPQSLVPKSANAVAARLLELGFPGRARTFVAADADGSAGRDRQLLRARAALAMGRPRQAQVDLLGRTDADANSLRESARALIAQQDATRAISDMPGADLTAQRAPATGTDAPEDVGTLAQSRALIDDANRVRQELNALLAANPAPAPFEE